MTDKITLDYDLAPHEIAEDERWAKRDNDLAAALAREVALLERRDELSDLRLAVAQAVNVARRDLRCAEFIPVEKVEDMLDAIVQAAGFKGAERVTPITPPPPPPGRTTFRDLKFGDQFDWIGPKHASFFDRCAKVSARCYIAIGVEGRMQVGSINAEVFHVNITKEN